MIYLVLPAYNEEKDMASLLERVRVETSEHGLDCRVIVVNDGSTDATAEVAARFSGLMPLEVQDHGGNRGLGQAILTGLSRAAALADDQDVVITMDADNTHNPALMPSMARQIDAGLDLVVASRYAPGGEEIGLSTFRKVCSGGASFLLRLFFPIRGVKDYTCGYRAYRAGLLRQAFAVYGDRLVEERGFTCMAEVLIKLRAMGARMGEVPLVLRYDLKSGASKMKVLRTVGRYIVLVARTRLRRLPRLPGNQEAAAPVH